MTKMNRSRASKLYITCSYFKSLKFFSGTMAEPLRSHFAKMGGGGGHTTSMSYSAKVCSVSVS